MVSKVLSMGAVALRMRLQDGHGAYGRVCQRFEGKHCTIRIETPLSKGGVNAGGHAVSEAEGQKSRLRASALSQKGVRHGCASIPIRAGLCFDIHSRVWFSK